MYLSITNFQLGLSTIPTKSLTIVKKPPQTPGLEISQLQKKQTVQRASHTHPQPAPPSDWQCGHLTTMRGAGVRSAHVGHLTTIRQMQMDNKYNSTTAQQRAPCTLEPENTKMLGRIFYFCQSSSHLINSFLYFNEKRQLVRLSEFSPYSSCILVLLRLPRSFINQGDWPLS